MSEFLLKKQILMLKVRGVIDGVNKNHIKQLKKQIRNLKQQRGSK
jgi:hypothetical protein